MAKADEYKRVKNLITRAERWWESRHRAMTDKVEFLLDGKHYRDDSEELSRDSEDIRWIGQESFHVHRHEVGTLTSTPTDLTAHVVDDDMDPAMAEVLGERVVAILEAEMDDPWKGWLDFDDDIASCASAASIGVGTLDVIEHGARVEAYPRFLDPRNYMRDPTVKSVHSPRCRWVILRDSITKDEGIRRGFNKKLVESLAPDGGFSAGHFQLKEKETHAVARTGQRSNVAEEWSEDDEFTVYYVYERKPSDKRDRPVPGTLKEWPDSQRFMACECGWRSDPQGDSTVYPENGTCPECGEVTSRIDGLEETETVLAYPDGKLSVWAPWTGTEKPLYEGPWPVPCRSYPFFEIVRHRHPFKPYGPSLADLNWWNQTFTDMVMRLIGERMIQSAPFWVAPLDGLEDAAGEPWRFSTDNGWAAFYSGSARPDIHMLEGVGVPPAFSSVYTMARNALVSHTGIADFGMDPQASRNIPATSAALQVQQQEIPQAHYLRRFQREKARFVGILWDYLRHIDQRERPMRYRNQQGQEVVEKMRPADFPNFEFNLTTTPDFSAMDKAKQEGLQTLLGIGQQFGPDAVDLFAQVYKLPPSYTSRVKRLLPAPVQPDPNMPPPENPPQQAPEPGAMVERLLSTMTPQP